MLNKIIPYIKGKEIYLILLFSLILRLIYPLFNNFLWWDSHIYIGIGKYIFSNGTLGIWEPYRPLVYPFILGLFWKIGINPIIFGKFFDMILSLIVIYLTFILSKEIFNKKTAIISSLILSISPVFLMFTNLLQTELLAMTFGLLGIILFIKNKNLLLVGFLLSLSFLTKFPQGIWFASVFIVLLLRKKIKELIYLSLGFSSLVLPFLIFNYFMYGNFLYSFTSATAIIETFTWMYGTGSLYYIKSFFLRNLIYLLVFIYFLIFIIKKHWKNKSELLLIIISILTFLYFLQVPRKEIRYIATIMPLLSIITGYMLLKIYNYEKKLKIKHIKPLAFILISITLIIYPLFFMLDFQEPQILEKETISTLKNKDFILSTQPFPMSYGNWKTILLGGLEFTEKIYSNYKNNYTHIFINDCDFICKHNDVSCFEKKSKLIHKISSENKELFSKKVKNCTAKLFINENSRFN